MKTLLAVDLDGTIAHAGDRFSLAGPEPSRLDPDIYRAWVDRVQNHETLLNDKLVPGMQWLLWSLEYGQNLQRMKVIYLTAREEKWRGVTEQWLAKHKLPKFELIMRPDDNEDESGVFKEKMINLAIAAYGCDEVVVLDDDQRGDIHEVCLANGWTFFKACSGS